MPQPSDKLSDFREKCYYFGTTSLDGAAHDLANEKREENPNIDVSTFLNLPEHVITSRLIDLMPNRTDDNTEAVLKTAVEYLRQSKKKDRSVLRIDFDKPDLDHINLNDAMDAISRVLEGLQDQQGIKEGEIRKIRRGAAAPIKSSSVRNNDNDWNFDNFSSNPELAYRYFEALRTAIHNQSKIDPEIPDKEKREQQKRQNTTLVQDCNFINKGGLILQGVADSLGDNLEHKKLKTLRAMLTVVKHEFDSFVLPSVQLLNLNDYDKKRGK